MKARSNGAVRDWLGFGAMCVGMFVALLDIQVVSAVLPAMGSALHTGLDRLSWIQTAYLTGEVIAVALSGRLSRALSTTGAFSAATIGFVIASAGCAASSDFASLVVWRTIQGLCGGVIIPTVFSAGYRIFPKQLQARALLLAGGVAMLAPSLGPLVGGFIGERLSWNWVFLINVPTGIVVAATAYAAVHVDEPDPRAWKAIDLPALLGLAGSLTMLQVLLKLAPGDHWRSWRDLGLCCGTVLAGAVFVTRSVGARLPLVDLTPLKSTSFAAACALNFVVGSALYGCVYVLPLFLGFVRRHSSLEIGLIMTVMGATQLIAAPLATLASKRFSAAWLTAVGLALFGAGLVLNAFSTPESDAAALFWPQVLRGAAAMFCILPLTTAALDPQPQGQLANASALLNLMRNLGGAIGIGIVDTVINVRPPAIASHLTTMLLAGNRDAAAFVGLPTSLFRGTPLHGVGPAQLAFARPLVERAALTVAFNEAWLILGGLTIAALAITPLLRQNAPPP
ncbi:MAG: transporter [Candidatus Eremiobacteraeota bacterium]|nr:transporter [Candidatus Eremiobacteraeota bacterium]